MLTYECYGNTILACMQVCLRMLTYAYVCLRMLTYECYGNTILACMQTYAGVC